MWPLLLDITKEESMQNLRSLEIDAFSSLVSALRAQGSLNPEKLHLLKETSNMLHISQERHKAEIRRVVNDERLNTIAYHVNGERHCGEEWADEGQRLIPLMPRIVPQTAYSAIADEVADATNRLNKQLPLPVHTDRKRVAASPSQSSTSAAASSTSQNLYRGVEAERKRKHTHSMSMDNCVLAQHLMAPPKISKIQQLYRQKTMNKMKDQIGKLIQPNETINKTPEHPQSTKIYQKATPSSTTTSTKVNILQNITTKATATSTIDANVDQRVGPTQTPNQDGKVPKNDDVVSPKTNLNQRPSPPTSTSATSVSSTSNIHAPQVIPNASKTITTTDGQKLIVVSTHSSLTPNASILQRTLTTIPLKTVNPKYRLVSRDSNAVNQAASRQAALLAANKQKVAQMRNPAPRRVVPYSNVQVLNTAGGLKVLTGRKQVTVQKFPVRPVGNAAQVNERIRHLKPTVVNRSEVVKAIKEFPKQVINIALGSSKPISRVPPPLTNVEKVGNTTINLDANNLEENHQKSLEINGVNDSIDGVSEEKTIEHSVLLNSANETCDQTHQNGTEAEVAEILQCEDVIPTSDEDISRTEDNAHEQSVESSNVGSDLNNSDSFGDESHQSVQVEDGLEENEVVAETQIVEIPDEEEEVLQENSVGYEEKVDLDSSVFIYDNANEEVIIEGIDDQPLEVLNAVHTLDESFSNLKDVRS